jgi:phosphoribosylcarboxyaminoimidazole (NCAIR) mutase
MPENGTQNAALLAVEILALSDKAIAAHYQTYRKRQRDSVIQSDATLRSVGWQQFLKKGQR